MKLPDTKLLRWFQDNKKTLGAALSFQNGDTTCCQSVQMRLD